ncbi:MAG: VPDSG-CTERM sorting domain-containing protein [Verrucomicrobia bacterium]|nr:VPDSG-CTERM sorting domain-containing protein [Verrucomicrobiota bacterium]
MNLTKSVTLSTLILASAGVANAFPIYTGSISYSADISATPLWDKSTTSLSWVVKDTGLTQGGNVIWNYEYTWSTADKNLSHIIIELSNTSVVISNLKVNGATGSTSNYEIKTYTVGGNGDSNVGLPGDIIGIKLDDKADLTTTTFSFDTVNSPVWGDFYAKDGTSKVGNGNDAITYDTYAYNTTFLAADPTDAPSNGSINHHVLRPDTVTTRVPDGGSTIFLFSSALVGLGLIRRRIH